MLSLDEEVCASVCCPMPKKENVHKMERCSSLITSYKRNNAALRCFARQLRCEGQFGYIQINGGFKPWYIACFGILPVNDSAVVDAVRFSAVGCNPELVIVKMIDKL